MVLIKGVGSIEEKIKHETETRRIIRHQEDRLYHGKYFSGHKDTPSRGDYGFCTEGAKYLDAMRRHPKDIKKISEEYHDWQASQRKYGDGNFDKPQILLK